MRRRGSGAPADRAGSSGGLPLSSRRIVTPGRPRLAVAVSSQYPDLRPDWPLLSRALTDRAAYSVLVGILAIARESGISVIAEGIETLETLSLVQQLKVQYGQGYLLGCPDETIPEVTILQNLIPFLPAGSHETSASTDESLMNPLHDIYA